MSRPIPVPGGAARAPGAPRARPAAAAPRVGGASAPPHAPPPGLARRQVLGAAVAAGLGLRLQAAQAVSAVPSLAEVERQWARGRPVTEGRVTLEVPPLVENGNAVPIRVRVDSAMAGTDRVLELVVFNEKNPQREVLQLAFGPASPRAQADARIRLATSQQLVALARLADGSQWSQHVDVVVTLAACIET